VTSKYQVTIPKAIAVRYGIAPGQDIDWLPAGDAIRVVPAGLRDRARDRARRLDLFDRATARQCERDVSTAPAAGGDRGWRRQELYRRGLPG
jgi:bifunctional DNA-binding transcriptional regulator/antitoxin component of YhaV-PrlF toxin-antitoxin module